MADQSKYLQKLKGKKVLIVGGTSGIGFAVAEALIEHGCTVVVASSRQAKVDGAITRLTKAYPSAKDRLSGHTCDLSSESTLEQNIVALFEKAGKLDHVVYTAGDALTRIPLADLTVEKFKQSGMVRSFAPAIFAKYIKEFVNDSHESSFTLTTGSVGEKPLPGVGPAAAHATGLFGMAKALAVDLKPVRVNIVAPGAVKTELWNAFPAEKVQGMMQHMQSQTLTGVIQGPEQVAEAFVYLIKDYNVTGASISTNGGALLS